MRTRLRQALHQGLPLGLRFLMCLIFRYRNLAVSLRCAAIAGGESWESYGKVCRKRTLAPRWRRALQRRRRAPARACLPRVPAGIAKSHSTVCAASAARSAPTRSTRKPNLPPMVLPIRHRELCTCAGHLCQAALWPGRKRPRSRDGSPGAGAGKVHIVDSRSLEHAQRHD